VVFIAPSTHAQTVGCNWDRVERAGMPATNINNTIHRYTSITTSGGKLPHPFLRVTASGDVRGRTVTARIRVVNLRGRIGSLMRSGTAPALTNQGYAWAHTWRGTPGHWQRAGNASVSWDGPDWLWEWVFTGGPNATAGDHSFKLDTWWLIAFTNGQGFDCAQSAYNQTHTWANTIEYTCTVN
jgi:hypothetical protein